jgi:hypothetical protein
LGQLWLNYGRVREAEPFLTRAADLDPYWVRQLGGNGGQAGQERLRLERLEWTGAAAAVLSGTPDWVATISEIDAEADAETPEWALGLGQRAEPPETMSVEEALVFDMTDTGDQIAPWDEDFIEQSPDEQITNVFEVEETDDWVDELAGELGEFPVPDLAPPADTGDDDSWMEELGLAEGTPTRTPTGLTGELEMPDETPEWLEDVTGGLDAGAGFPSAEGEIEPDWLTGEDFGAPQAEEPDWMNGAVTPDLSAVPADMPDWMSEDSEPAPSGEAPAVEDAS